MINIIFDECISSKMIAKINDIVQYHPSFSDTKIHHLQDYYRKGIKDHQWIPQLNKDWIIVTTDRGIKSKKDEKLPLICIQKKIKHVLISKGLHSRKQFYKAVAILYCWDEILNIKNQSLYLSYKLKLRDLKPKLEPYKK